MASRIIPGVIIVVMLTYILTGRFLKYAVKKSIVDIPNERSSHSQVTPRGGGLAFTAVTLAVVLVLTLFDFVSGQFAAALIVGGLFTAVIGWIDDCGGARILTRAAVHFFAALWAVIWLGGISNLDLGITFLPLGLIGSLLTVIGIVWFINLYNFMDGIDGLAGSQAVFVGLVGGALCYAMGSLELALVSWVLAAAGTGFLFWNWPPAKIFMGDVGSGFLGYSFAVIALAGEKTGGLPLLVWVLLLGVFMVDATLTLIRRMVRGEKWYEPHRSHAYQLAVQAGYSHKQVTLSVMGLNVILAGLAILTWQWPALMLWFFMVGLLGLILLYIVVVRRFESRYSVTGTGKSHEMKKIPM